VTELEILRRRRELVLLSAQLQRATVVRRLDNVSRHPARAVFGLVTSAASVPLLFKLGALVIGRVGRKRKAREAARRAGPTLLSKALFVLRFVPALKMFPALKFLNR
jgi:hypothetical protein